MELSKAYAHIMRLSQSLNIMCLWTKNKYKYGRDIDELLNERGYKRVAVYGIGDIGECIINSLIRSNKIDLCCGIDRDPSGCYVEALKVYSVNEIPENVELIIVSIPDRYDEIKESLKVKQEVISIEELVYGLSNVK